MFAVIRNSSKQYKVKEGDLVDLELLDLKEDQKDITFEDILLVGEGEKIKVGAPTVTGASVTAEVIGEVKADKVIAYKYKRRKGYHRTVGHRQQHLRVKITGIKG